MYTNRVKYARNPPIFCNISNEFLFFTEKMVTFVN